MKHPETDALWMLAGREVASVEVKAHVQSCETCQKKVDAFRATQVLLPPAAAVPKPPPLSAEAWARLDARVRDQTRAQLEPSSRKQAVSSPLRWGLPVAVAASVVFWWVLPRSPPPQPPVAAGTLLVVAASHASSPTGEVTRARRLIAGEQVETGKGGEVQLRFQDGSEVALRESSLLTVLAVSESESAVLLERGSVEIAAPHRPERMLRVHSGGLEVRDVGTRFAVSRRDAEVEVSVREGEVEVRGAGQPPVRLWAGEVRRFSEGDGSDGGPAPSLQAKVRSGEGEGDGGASVFGEARRTGASSRVTTNLPAVPVLGPSEALDVEDGGEDVEGAAPADAGHLSASTPASTSGSQGPAGSPSGLPTSWAGLKDSLGKARAKIRPPFAPLGSSEYEQRAKDVQRLADEGSCALSLARAEAWLTEFKPQASSSSRDGQLRKAVLQTKARCLQSLGRNEEAASVREEAARSEP